MKFGVGIGIGIGIGIGVEVRNEGCGILTGSLLEVVEDLIEIMGPTKLRAVAVVW